MHLRTAFGPDATLPMQVNMKQNMNQRFPAWYAKTSSFSSPIRNPKAFRAVPVTLSLPVNRSRMGRTMAQSHHIDK